MISSVGLSIFIMTLSLSMAVEMKTIGSSFKLNETNTARGLTRGAATTRASDGASTTPLLLTLTTIAAQRVSNPTANQVTTRLTLSLTTSSQSDQTTSSKATDSGKTNPTDQPSQKLPNKTAIQSPDHATTSKIKDTEGTIKAQDPGTTSKLQSKAQDQAAFSARLPTAIDENTITKLVAITPMTTLKQIASDFATRVANYTSSNVVGSTASANSMSRATSGADSTGTTSKMATIDLASSLSAASLVTTMLPRVSTAKGRTTANAVNINSASDIKIFKGKGEITPPSKILLEKMTAAALDSSTTEEFRLIASKVSAIESSPGISMYTTLSSISTTKLLTPTLAIPLTSAVGPRIAGNSDRIQSNVTTESGKDLSAALSPAGSSMPVTVSLVSPFTTLSSQKRALTLTIAQNILKQSENPSMTTTEPVSSTSAMAQTASRGSRLINLTTNKAENQTSSAFNSLAFDKTPSAFQQTTEMIANATQPMATVTIYSTRVSLESTTPSKRRSTVNQTKPKKAGSARTTSSFITSYDQQPSSATVTMVTASTGSAMRPVGNPTKRVQKTTHSATGSTQRTSSLARTSTLRPRTNTTARSKTTKQTSQTPPEHLLQDSTTSGLDVMITTAVSGIYGLTGADNSSGKTASSSTQPVAPASAGASVSEATSHALAVTIACAVCIPVAIIIIIVIGVIVYRRRRVQREGCDVPMERLGGDYSMFQ